MSKHITVGLVALFSISSSFALAPKPPAQCTPTTNASGNSLGPLTFFQKPPYTLASTGSATFTYCPSTTQSNQLPIQVTLNGSISFAEVSLNGLPVELVFNLFGKDFSLGRSTVDLLSQSNTLSVSFLGDKTGKASISVIIAGPQAPVPADPTTTAPVLSTNKPTTIADSTAFLYTGANPIQTGVTAGTILAQSAAVVRGKLLASDGNALTGATVTVIGHPEFGQTLSRADGEYDLAVNGGEVLTMAFSKSGYITSQRSVSVLWQNYTPVPNVVLLATDASVSSISLGATSAAQIHLATAVTDSAGTRQSAIVFPAGTSATLAMPNGTTQSASTLSVRATEFTVGANGQMAMPGNLPANSTYTFAAELSADEAIAAGATAVDFSQPVYHYVNNFLNFPVGTPVPAGYYDRTQAAWIPSSNGLVIKILSVTGGTATIDVDGAGKAATSAELSALGFTTAELKLLASNYTASQTLWRTPIQHFTPWDENFSSSSELQTAESTASATNVGTQLNQSTCAACPCPVSVSMPSGSTVSALNQTVQENFPIAGTPFFLNYASDRHLGRTTGNTIQIPVTPASVASSIQQILLTVSVAGQSFAYAIPPTPNQSYSFTWNGLDAYGRQVSGTQTAFIELSYLGQATYTVPTLNPDFGVPSIQQFAVAVPTVQSVENHKSYTVNIGNFDVEVENLGGLSLNVMHQYDANSQTIYLGDGTTKSVQPSDALNVTTFAGNGIRATSNQTGNAGTATSVELFQPTSLAVMADGSLLMAETSEIRQVNLSGQVQSISGSDPDQTHFNNIVSMAAVNPNSIWYSDNGTLNYLSYNNVLSFGNSDVTALAVQNDGTLYVVSEKRTLSKLRLVDFQLEGGGMANVVQAVGQDEILSVAVAADGSKLYVGTAGGHLWEFEGNNWGVDLAPVYSGFSIINVVTDSLGNAYFTTSSNTVYKVVNGSAQLIPILTNFAQLGGIAVSQNGTIYVSQTYQNYVNAIAPSIPFLSTTNFSVASSDGSEIWDFDSYGRHVDTRDSLTNAKKYSFTRDSNGSLQSITDVAGNVTTLQLSSGGGADSITSPYGVQTTLGWDSTGHISSVSDPTGSTYALTYIAATGLLNQLNYPNAGEVAYHSYDSLGRVVSDQDAADSIVQLASSQNSTSNQLSYNSQLTSGQGIVTQFQLLSTPTQTSQKAIYSDSTFNSYSSNGMTATSASQDQTVSSSSYSADPRFGTQSFYPGNYAVTTPSGLTETIATTKSIVYGTPSGGVTPFVLTTSSSTNGNVATSIYSSATQTLTNTSAEGRVASQSLDSLGRTVQSQISGINAMTYQYDPRGNLSSINQGTRSTEFTYDAHGFLSSIQLLGQNPTTYTRDAAGRILQQTLQDGRTIAYAYDADGNLTSITPPGKTPSLFSYTPVGLQQTYTPPPMSGAGATQNSYNKDRQLTEVIRPDGTEISYGYDPVTGKLSTMTTPRGTVQYSYNSSTGKVSSITYPSQLGGTSQEDFGFDGFLSTGLTWNFSGDGTGISSYTVDYDNFFDFSKTISFSTAGIGSFTANYMHDRDNLLTSVDLISIQRSAQNGLIVGTTSNGSGVGGTTIQDTFTRDGYGAVTAYQSEKTSNSSVYYQEQLTRDNLGRIVTKQETDDTDIPHEWNYTYDPAGRLTAVNLDGVATQYGYDSNSNRVSMSSSQGSITATYDAQDRILTYGSLVYGYTPNGEVQTKTDQSSGQQTSFAYDSLGNLVQATLPTGQSIQYDVDPLSHRTMRVSTGGVLAGKVKYLAEPDGTLAGASYSLAGKSVLETFIYNTGGRVPDSLRTIVTAGTRISGAYYKIILDERGSVREVVDGSGNIAQVMDYDEFGNVTRDTNPGFQPFGFAGCLYDPDTKLCNFGAREFDPNVGRWMQKDPILFSGGDTNLYGYVLNDPVNLTDASGKFFLVDDIATAFIAVTAVGTVVGISSFIATYLSTGSASKSFSAAGSGFISGSLAAGTAILTYAEGGVLAVGLGALVDVAVSAFTGPTALPQGTGPSLQSGIQSALNPPSPQINNCP